MTTEQILDHIREICGLKRLEFGCEVTLLCDENLDYPKRKVYDIFRDHIFVTNYGVITEKEIKEIIGLPVHLEHLLFILKEKAVIRLYSEYLLIEYNYKTTNYDLTKTVEQNLNESDVLRNIIINIIKK